MGKRILGGFSELAVIGGAVLMLTGIVVGIIKLAVWVLGKQGALFLFVIAWGVSLLIAICSGLRELYVKAKERCQ